MDTFNSSSREAEAGRALYEFEANLLYKVSSRIARAVTQRNPVLKKTSVCVSYMHKFITYLLQEKIEHLQL